MALNIYECKYKTSEINQIESTNALIVFFF